MGQAPPPAGGWAPPPGGAGAGMAHNTAASGGASPRAMASLGLAIAALVLCCGPLTGIPAAILGWLEIGAIKEGRSSQAGLMFAQIGLWGGLIVSVLNLVGVVVLMAMSAVGGAM